jgi:hypothetical protein
MGADYSLNIRGAEIAENKIVMLFNCNYIDLKKNRSATFELRDAKNPIAPR